VTGARSPALLGVLGPLGVAIAVLYLYAATLSPRAFQTHEGLHPYARTQQLLAEWARGHVPPQVFPDAVGGLGAAFPRYYPPLPYAVGTLLAALTGDLVWGVNLAFLLAALTSAATGYAFVRGVVGDDRLAICGALVAVSAPYRLAQVFVRGALAEAWSLALHPLVLLGCWRAIERGQAPVYLPLALAGLLLSHQITLPFALPLFMALALVAARAQGPRVLARLAAMAVLGVGLAGFFLVPQRAGLGDLRLADPVLMGATPAAVALQRVRPGQLLESPSAERWFGLARPEPEPDQMSFAFGWVPLLAFPLAVVAWARGRASAARRVGLVLVGFSLGALAFAVWPRPWFLLLPDSMAYVQFPWRLLGLSGLSAALGLPLCLGALGLGERGRWASAALGLAAVACVPPFERQALSRPQWTSGHFSPETVGASGALGFTVQGEYLPHAYLPGMPAPQAPAISAGRVVSWRREGAALFVELDAPDGGEVTLPVFAFDFQHARDGAGTTLRARAAGPWLKVVVPPGTRQLRVAPRPVAAAKWGLALSVSSLVALVVSVGRGRRRAVDGPRDVGRPGGTAP